jgi:GH25 family lysozyme M1 (1,4-beta-N-acetylmuramidase)
MYGIDVHSEFQADISFNKVKEEGYDAVFIKVSEGTNFVPGGLKDFVGRAKGKDFVLGYYHFLTNAQGDRQAAHFCKKVRDMGGPKNRVLIADFEAYGSRTPSNRNLKDFVRGVKKRFPGKKVLLYSGYGFWTGGDSSGDASDYDVDGLWDARYPDLNKHDHPKRYYEEVKGWLNNQPRWGGTPPPKTIARQFTSTGRVAGLYVDVNKFLITRKELEDFAR